MSSKALAARHQPTRALQFKRTPIWADIHRDLLHEKVRVWCVVVRDLLSDPPQCSSFLITSRRFQLTRIADIDGHKTP